MSLFVGPGDNEYEFTAIDSNNQSVSQTITLSGIQPDGSQVDFTQFADVTGSFDVAYARTSYNTSRSSLHAETAVENVGQFPADAPLLVAIANISDPMVLVRDADGQTPDGLSYYDFTGLVTGGTLDPQGQTGFLSAAFYNPNRTQFTYDLLFFGKLNEPPQFTSLPATTADLGREYTYQVDAFDPNGEAISFELLEGPASMTIDAASGLIRWTPGNDDAGVHSVAVQVADERFGTSTQRFSITARLTPANRAPVFTSLPLDTAEVGQVYPYAAAAVDADGDALTFSIVSGPSGMTIDAGTGQISWTPIPQQLGNQSVVVEVGDSRGGAAQQAYSLLVISPPDNLAPSIVNPPPTAVKLGAMTHQVLAHDADGESLTYQLLDGPAGMAIDTSGLITWTSTAGDLGAHQVIVQVLDTRGGTDTQNFMLAVFDNDDPTISSQPVVAAQVGNAYSYQVTATDSVDDMLSYKLLDAPPGMTIDNATGLVGWDVTDAAYEQESVTVAVMDGRGGSATQQFTIDVTDGKSLANNVNPFFVSVAPTVASVGTKLLYDVDARDPNGDTLSYDLPLAPDGMVIDPVTGQLGWQPRADQPGMQQVVIRAKDGTNSGIWLQSIPVIVDAANTAPVITSSPISSASVGNPWEYRLHAQDADGDPLMFELLEPASGMTLTALDAGDASAVLSFTPGAAGNVEVVLAVKDSRGGVAQQGFTVAVAGTSANIAPVVHSLPRASIAAGKLWFYLIEADDPNGDPLGIALTEAPDGMTLDPLLRSLSWEPTLAQLGSHAVTLTFDDGRGGSTEQSFSVEVASVHENTAPRIVTPPSAFRATLGRAFEYDLRSEDSENDPVEWTIVEAPQGASLDRRRGTLRWTPTLDHIGTLQRFEISAKDPAGLEALQSFSLLVSGANLAPMILSRPPSEAVAEERFVYGVRAIDAENDALVFALTEAPAGMTIDAQRGIVRWTPTLAQLGTHRATVEVSDSQGNASSQTFEVVVTQVVRNKEPVITSRAVFKARVDAEYRYDVEAVDPEAETITYSLVESPSGMQIDSATGVITWTPTAAQAGAHLVRVAAADTSGNVGVQRFAIQARANQAPVINSTAPTTVSLGGVYRYDLQVSDAENDPLTFALLVAPTGMEIDARGRIRWTTSPGVELTNPVAVEVTDSFGASVMQTYTLDVTPDSTAPKVALQLSANPLALGQDTVVLVQASDDVGVVDLILTLDGVPQVLDGNNSLTLRGNAAGLFNLKATARDASGNEASSEVQLRVFDPADTQGPTITITTPAPNQIVTTLTDIVGSVTDDNLQFYRVDYGRADLVDVNKPTEPDPDYKQLVRKNAAAVDEVLATFDPTMLHNDDYVIRILAQDLSGNVSAKTLTLGMDGQLKLGQFELDFTDLSIPVAGIPITVTRSYDTRDAGESGDFGFGWTLSVSDPNIRETLPVNEFERQGLSRAATPFRDGTRVYLTNPEGRRVAFTFRPQRQFSLFGGGSWSARCVPDPGVYDRLDVGELQLRQVNGAFYHGFDGAPFNPNAYRLTTKDGTVYAYGQFGGLDHIIDRNSNRIDIRPNGVFSSLGPSIEFIRDPQGRISQIIDPAGNPLTYTYDLSGNLRLSSNQNGQFIDYSYSHLHPHYLTGITNSGDIMVTRAEYDAAGHLASLSDAGGQRVNYAIDRIAQHLRVINPRGNTTDYFYDLTGNLRSEINALGFHREFNYQDAMHPYLPTSFTDERGFTTTYTFDSNGNTRSITDPTGASVLAQYNSNHQLLSTTDAVGRTSIYAYDAKGNLATAIDATGVQTSVLRDGVGRPTTFSIEANTLFELGPTTLNAPSSIAQANGAVFRLSYDKLGNLLQFSFPQTGGLSFEYDAAGNLTHEVDQELAVSLLYDAAGFVTAINANGQNLAIIQRDEQSRISRYIDSQGQEEQYRYDASSNVIEVIDRVGRRRLFFYDPLDRLETERWIENASVVEEIRYAYDPTGNLISVDTTDTSLRIEYDARNRVVIQSKYLHGAQIGTLAFEYDQHGNTKLAKDNLGMEIHSEYDARSLLVDRVWQSNALGEARVRIDRDTQGRIVNLTRMGPSTTDLESVTTTLSYTSEGEVQQIVHADVTGSTIVSMEYSYDLMSKLISETFDGVTTAYTYAINGSLLSATREEEAFESYTYDSFGNRLSTLSAETLQIGSANRLVSDGTNSYSYDTNGNLVTKIRLADNSKTDFSYDFRGRLVTVRKYSDDLTEVSKVQFIYDGLNYLVAKLIDNQLTYMTSHDGLDALVEYGKSGEPIYYLYVGTDNLVGSLSPEGGLVWTLNDRKGSARVLVDNTGHQKSRIDYDSFGVRTAVIGDPENALHRFGYAGYEYHDQLGLYYLRSRFYSPDSARFISEDPLKIGSGQVNQYVYVQNDPHSFVDPLGLVAQAGGEYGAVETVPAVESGITNSYARCIEQSLGDVLKSSEFHDLAIHAFLEVLGKIVLHDPTFKIPPNSFRGSSAPFQWSRYLAEILACKVTVLTKQIGNLGPGEHIVNPLAPYPAVLKRGTLPRSNFPYIDANGRRTFNPIGSGDYFGQIL